MRKLLCVLFYFACSINAFPQIGDFSLGARNAGLAGTSVTLSDEFSIINNVGGLGRISNHAAFVGYQNRYNVSEFQVIGGGGIFHHEFGNTGIGFRKFGDATFSEQRTSIAFGNKLQLISLGLGFDWIQYRIASIGSRHLLAINFGGVFELTPSLILGAHIFNINQTTITDQPTERVPTVMKGGLSLRPTNELELIIEVEKDLSFEEIFKVGIEYEIVRSVLLRTGIQPKTKSGAFGIGLHPKKLKIDYAYTNSPALGAIHELSLARIFKK